MLSSVFKCCLYNPLYERRILRVAALDTMEVEGHG